MSDPGIVVIIMSGVTAVVYTIRTIANTVLRLEERRAAAKKVNPVSDDRLARLEMAVESIAVEVERISEGQRFTTRLLTEQAHAVVPKLQPGEFDTPH
ncbi:MAG: hypothetical protein ABI681_05765 [Gemmatimonadales bacterium]